MATTFEAGTRVRANARYRASFPISRAQRGCIIGRPDDGPLRTVKWDDLTTPQRLHVQFLDIDPEDGDQPLTEDRRADLHLRF